MSISIYLNVKKYAVIHWYRLRKKRLWWNNC